MKKAAFSILALGLLLGPAACKKEAKTQPWAGVWTLDAARSRLDKAPQQETMQIESADESALKYSIRGISDQGSQYTETYDGKADGNPYPVMVNGKELGKIAFSWQSERVLTAQGKGLGGSSLTEVATLSDDGKIITIRTREGEEKEEAAVYRR
jgi:hypothetical protein